MAKRFTDTEKWSDDWFLELPPLMKCVWEYLRDHVDGGTGIMKVSFKKMSSDIRGKVTREDFERHIGSRIHWISHDTIWVPGFIHAQFKALSAKNKAHVNMAKKVISIVGEQKLSERSQKYFDALLSIVQKSTLERPSTESQPTLIGYRIQDKGKELEGGVGEEKHFDLESLWDEYPQKVGWSNAMVLLKEQIKCRKDFTDFQKAMRRYIADCRKNHRYLKDFDNFAKLWRDWLKDGAGVASTVSPVEIAPETAKLFALNSASGGVG